MALRMRNDHRSVTADVVVQFTHKGDGIILAFQISTGGNQVRLWLKPSLLTTTASTMQHFRWPLVRITMLYHIETEAKGQGWGVE